METENYMDYIVPDYYTSFTCKIDHCRSACCDPFHPDSPNWPESFSEAAKALEKPGDISEPVYTDQGVHILYYVGDVPAGDHVLTNDERQLLNAAALRYYQLEKLNGLIEGWEADYEIETHPELLKY